jgi:hypothetical protein
MQSSSAQKTNSKWLHIIVTQIICVSLILISLLTANFFLKNTYKELKNWYNENICNDTNIDEVLKSGDSNEI